MRCRVVCPLSTEEVLSSTANIEFKRPRSFVAVGASDLVSAPLAVPWAQIPDFDCEADNDCNHRGIDNWLNHRPPSCRDYVRCGYKVRCSNCDLGAV